MKRASEYDSGDEEFGDNIVKRVKSGSAVSDIGTIEYIELVNFMCHSFLKVNLGPKINFIIGRNGSGKSAILTALTVAMGAKAHFTNRAGNLRSLLKTGASAGSIQISLRNEGEDAFKPSVYGRRIVIERKIVKEGSCGYRIMDEHKRTICTKRETLNQILEHMMIQVENPLAVLTQDTARMFLSSSTPKEKYGLFLKGTGLKQLKDDYINITKNTTITRQIIQYKHKVGYLTITYKSLGELDEELQELKRKWNDLEKSKGLEDECQDARDELIWAHVEEKENELQVKQRNVEKIERKLLQNQELKDESQRKLVEIEAKEAHIKNIIDEHSKEVTNLCDRQKEIKDDHSRIQTQIRGINSDEREISSSIDDHQRSSDILSTRIEAENQRIQNDTAESRKLQELKIRDFEFQKEELKTETDETVKMRDLAEQKSESLKMEMESLKSNLEGLKYNIRKTSENISNLKSQKSEKLNAYGKSMHLVMREIEQADNSGRWRGRKPVGPLGAHISVTDKKYEQCIQTVLNQSLSAFCVETNQDRAGLQQILDKYSMNNAIYVCQRRNIDYCNGEPDERFKTFLRVLKIDNPIVTNVLIINHNIEKIILVDTRAEGDHITGRGFPNNVSSVYTMHCQMMGAKGGGYATTSLRPYNGPPLLAVNIEEYIKKFENEREQLKFRANQEELKQEPLWREYQNLQSDLSMLRDKLRLLVQKQQRIDFEISSLNEALREQEPENISALLEAKSVEDDQIRILSQQLSFITKQKEDLSNNLNSLKQAEEEINRNIKHLKDTIASLERDMETLVTARCNSEAHLRHLEQKAEQYEELANQERFSLSTQEAMVQEAIGLAEEECERVDVTMSMEELNRKVQSLEARIREKESEYGSREDLYNALMKKSSSFEEGKAQLEKTVSLLEYMTSTVKNREEIWLQFRKTISVTAKSNFRDFMKKRGYLGKLILDHENEALNLLVQVEDNSKEATQDENSNLEKDPKSLSGGEKSYSTICLLLSLWASMRNPFRALDEFDVFMDAVNRRISMKLLIENSLGESCQYIFITPQDMSHIKGIDMGDEIRIHKLHDPERGQTTLNFTENN